MLDGLGVEEGVGVVEGDGVLEGLGVEEGVGVLNVLGLDEGVGVVDWLGLDEGDGVLGDVLDGLDEEGVIDGLVGVEVLDGEGERLVGLDVVELETRFCSSYHRSHKI